MSDIDQAKKAAVGKIKLDAQSRILASVPEWKQRSAALGVYGDSKKNELRDTIKAITDGSDAAEAAVNALTTVDEVQSFTW